MYYYSNGNYVTSLTSPYIRSAVATVRKDNLDNYLPSLVAYAKSFSSAPTTYIGVDYRSVSPLTTVRK